MCFIGVGDLTARLRSRIFGNIAFNRNQMEHRCPRNAKQQARENGYQDVGLGKPFHDCTRSPHD
ncbi:hypothetical protein AXG89_40330 [Burkholderia sp. PAMC 26561]|nr:hypothetical protein AXG89_40330 [Burkholderia sp. PAMC 26561]